VPDEAKRKKQAALNKRLEAQRQARFERGTGTPQQSTEKVPKGSLTVMSNPVSGRPTFALSRTPYSTPTESGEITVSFLPTKAKTPYKDEKGRFWMKIKSRTVVTDSEAKRAFRDSSKSGDKRVGKVIRK
jgi:hypothetical protein